MASCAWPGCWCFGGDSGEDTPSGKVQLSSAILRQRFSTVFLLVVPILILQGVCYQLCAFVKWPRVSYTYLNISHSRAILNTFYPFFYIFVMGFGASLPLHLFQSLTKLQQILVLLTFHSRGSGF